MREGSDIEKGERSSGKEEIKEIKIKEDEEEVVALCRKIFEVHNKCKALSQRNQELLSDIENKLKLIKIK